MAMASLRAQSIGALLVSDGANVRLTNDDNSDDPDRSKSFFFLSVVCCWESDLVKKFVKPWSKPVSEPLSQQTEKKKDLDREQTLFSHLNLSLMGPF